MEEEEAVGATYCERLDDLLQQSDFVMLAVNLTPQSQGLIGRRELSLMKPTATLINVGRGSCSTDIWAGKLCRRKLLAILSAFFFFFWLHLWHMEVPGPGVESELQL